MNLYRYIELELNSNSENLINLIPIIKEELSRLIVDISNSNSINESIDLFNNVMVLHSYVSILCYKFDVKVQEELKTFLFEFERLDDFGTLESIFEEIKKKGKLYSILVR